MGASGPVLEPKAFPAATMDDQDALLEGNQKTVVELGGVPFSSPDPATDAKKMVAIQDGTGATSVEPQAVEEPTEMKAGDFKAQVEAATTQEELDAVEKAHKDSGKNFSTVDAAVEKKQEELLVASVEAATDQDSLDAAAQTYADSGKKFDGVDAAVSKKQDEINEAAKTQGNGQ